MEQALAVGRRIAWVSLAASVVAFIAAARAIFIHVIHLLGFFQGAVGLRLLATWNLLRPP